MAGGDDVTMVVAHRSGPVPKPVGPVSRRTSRRWPAILGAALVASLIGVAAGWMLRDGDSPVTAAGTAATNPTATTNSTGTLAPGTLEDPVLVPLAPELPVSMPPLQSMLVNGGVLTFFPVTAPGAPQPTITLADGELMPRVSATEGDLTASVDVATGRVTISRAGVSFEVADLGRPVEAVRVVGEQIWVASNDGLQAIDPAGAILVAWQDFQPGPMG